MSSFTTPLEYIGTGTNEQGRPVYQLTAPFSYVVGSLDNTQWTITVPVGFETDLASIPWPFRLIFKPNGPWAKAAVIHDYLYRTLDWPFSAAIPNAVFYEAMLVSKVSSWVAWIFWTAVQVFGKPANVVQPTPAPAA